MLTNAFHNYLQSVTAKGVLCAVSIDGVVQTFSGGSITNEEHDTPFYIYSISKTFTAVATLLLCEQHGNFLDHSVQELLPHYEIPNEVTVKQLLNHTSGLSDYFMQKDYQDAVHNHPTKPWSYEKLMQVGLRKTPLFPAGETFSYSNPGYGMLKEIIELKSGLTFYDYIDRVIIKPLGLTETKPFTKLDLDHELLAGSDPEMDGDFRELYHPDWIATGCVISTVTEITQFYQALFSGKLVTQASLSEMTELIELKFPLPTPRIAAYGLGLMSAINDPSGVNFGHGGGGPGYTTYARHYPDYDGKQITIALVVNASLDRTPFELADEIFMKITKD